MVVAGHDTEETHDDDFHFYRQDASGGGGSDGSGRAANRWSHKPGGNTVRHVDARGDPIVDPRTAARDYSATGGKNYSQFCGYYCVPVGGGGGGGGGR